MPHPPWPPLNPKTPLAVLCSGGLDSAILLGEAVRRYPAVYPVYVRTGAYWEATEEAYLRRFLNALRSEIVRPLIVLDEPVGNLYGRHWSTTGDNVPGADSPDDAVFLPGRNVLLLAKPLIWCHLNGVPQLATAPLATNPFPDATPAFYDGIASIVNRAVGGAVRVIRPYACLGLRKVDVLRRGMGMPLQETFSCIHPVDDQHCGQCNKCAERQHGFRDANLNDPTTYFASESLNLVASESHGSTMG